MRYGTWNFWRTSSGRFRCSTGLPPKQVGDVAFDVPVIFCSSREFLCDGDNLVVEGVSMVVHVPNPYASAVRRVRRCFGNFKYVRGRKDD